MLQVRKDNGLSGIIKGDGILCFCDVCGGATVSFDINVAMPFVCMLFFEWMMVFFLIGVWYV